MRGRRSVRFFSSSPISLSTLFSCVEAASSAPSGGHQQPWRYCVVLNEGLKKKIRLIVEEQEKKNYEKRMKKEWIQVVKPLISDLHGRENQIQKPYLTEAPVLLVVLRQTHLIEPIPHSSIPQSNSNSNSLVRREVYYPVHSVGISVGMLISALHFSNLCTLTTTVMGAENQVAQLLGRNENEKVFLLMPIGYPAEMGKCTVPFRNKGKERLNMKEVMTVYE